MPIDRHNPPDPTLMVNPSKKSFASRPPESECPTMQTQEHSWGRPDLGQPIANFDQVNVEVETSSTAIRLRPHGPLLDAEIAHATIMAANTHTETPSGTRRRLILDVSEIVLPSSRVVGMLLEIARIADQADLEPILHGPNPALSDLMGMLQLDRRYTMSVSQRELDRAMAA